MEAVKRSIFFVTGTDTGVGKTVIACLLTQYWREAGRPVAALKPVCSGDREDARALRKALNGGLGLDRINPWHFRTPLSPLLAARREKGKLTLARVVDHIRAVQEIFPLLIVEGAGGLLSPLGEDFDSRDLIRELRALPIVVCPNRLGAINQARLVLAALPDAFARRAQIVLMSGRRLDAAGRSNPLLLREILGPGRVHVLPWLKFPEQPDRALSSRDVGAVLKSLTTQIQKQEQS
jgi:dethiobiotin synthetase